MRTLKYEGHEFNVPDKSVMLLNITAYTRDGFKSNTYWVPGLDEAAEKVNAYVPYIIKTLHGVREIEARVIHDDRGYRPFGLIAKYKMTEKPAWSLAVYDCNNKFVEWKHYVSLLKEVAIA